MKKILLIVTIIMLVNIAQCQITSNIISEAEYNNIKINNITLSDIKATEGDETQIRDLIPAIIEEKDINTGERGPSNYWFKYNGFEIAFTDNAGEPDHPGIAMFEITKNNWNITIQGVTVTIGDNTSVLGNVIFNTQTNGGRSIVYQYCDGCNNFISIYINAFNEVTKIIYMEQT
ncbi:MAG: hypothetical protein GKR88_09335 [Flavobacteriaceae bacterium]|nr:MAG: hypothetical protein GKR88_09335 [Flavobacteriaceae bacterium]